MTRKLFLRLDRGSLTGDDMKAFASAPPVSEVDSDEDCFQYTFEPVVLDHVLLLLGENKSRFGFDLWHYIHSAHGFFRQTSDGFVVMPDSTPDFKRRYSEDLGIAIGSLSLVDAIGLKWETVSQIPTNKRPDKHAKVPDFVGFDTNSQKRVYECKGTTRPQDVDKHRQKAKDQLADHSEANVSKLAMVTYIPTSSKLIPPYLFVSDPPIPLSFMTEAMAMGLHYLLACQFAGIDSLIEPLQQALAQQYHIKEILANGGEPSWQAGHDLDELHAQITALAGQLAQQENLQEFHEQQFAGIWRDAEDRQRKVRVFSGVSTRQVAEVAAAFTSQSSAQQPFTAPRCQSESVLCGGEEELFSLFSDGTLLLIKRADA